MANVTAERKLTTKKASYFDAGGNYNGVVLTGGTVYKGAMVGIDSATGTLRRGGGVIATFNGGILGRALKTVVAAVAGASSIDVEHGIFPWVNIGSITIASRGLLCYADDDQSVSLTATNVKAGIIYDVDSFGVWVLMGPGCSSL